MIEQKIDDITIYNTSKIFDKYTLKKEELEKQIASWIIENIEKDIICDIIDKNYEGFNKFDKKQILDRVLAKLDKSRKSREDHLEKYLANYLKDEKILNVAGFVRFRLKEYRLILESVTDKIIDKYIIEKEYLEFIGLIKEYLKYQKPLIPYLNVITTRFGTVYTDKNNKDITAKLARTYSFETDLSEEDKLLTILILSAPEKIVWHTAEQVSNKDLQQTIKSIFEDCVVFCQGCDICKKYEKMVLTIFEN